MPNITPSWDLFVLTFFAVVMIYSVFMGRNKIVGLLVNFYISLAVVLVAGETIYNMVANLGFVSSRLAVTQFAVEIITLVVLTATLSIKSEIAGLDSGGTISKLQAGFYGFLASGLALSTAFHFMSDANRIALDSNFVNLVASYFVVWAVAPILLMIGSSFIKKI
jgi:hypothetical protein